MNAVGWIGNYLYQGAGYVSGPFHPFGGAVDIIVVEQPDGSFKSSPWYVQFGKFQGLLKTMEKVVKISVNGVEADFHMYLNHKGEAYFLEEVEVPEGEVVQCPSSSGDDTDGESKRDHTVPLKSESCEFDVNKLDVCSQKDSGNGNVMAMDNSNHSRLLGFFFGPKSLKDSKLQDGVELQRASSLDRADVAVGLLEVKWPTNLAVDEMKNNHALPLSASATSSGGPDRSFVVENSDENSVDCNSKNADPNSHISCFLVRTASTSKQFDGHAPEVEDVSPDSQTSMETSTESNYDCVESSERQGFNEQLPGTICISSVSHEELHIQPESVHASPDLQEEDLVKQNLPRFGQVTIGASESAIGTDTEKDTHIPKVVEKPKGTKIPTTEQLTSLKFKEEMKFKEGMNLVTFTSASVLGEKQVDARIYLWKWNTHIVISDVDGTITKSDVLGQFMPLVGIDWLQTGVTNLFSAIKENGYQLLFLSARAISQAYLTRQFLFNIKQDGKLLPDGPVVISPDGLLPSLFREVIRRVPQEFKIKCLKDIKALFPSECNPFYAGFGNRDTDELSYLNVGIPRGKIFIINPRGEVAFNHLETKSYESLHDLVNGVFPPMSSNEQEDYNDRNYWKLPTPAINV